MNWPHWWKWQIEVTPHIEKRMEQRGFTLIDLRQMLQDARGLRQDKFEGRWIIETRHRNRNWVVIVDPDDEEQLLVVITAYRI